MIHSKVPLFAAALGAAATFGFVWLGRRSRRAIAARPVTALPAFGSDEAARADALRDLDVAAIEDDELDFVDVTELEPNSLDGMELRAFDEEPLVNDEPYDAVDPEGMGTEFLRRATESPIPTGDSESLPLVDEGADIAPELPVGRVDSDGSTELHAPENPTGPPTELSPNDEELAQRRSGDAPEGTSKPNE